MSTQAFGDDPPRGQPGAISKKPDPAPAPSDVAAAFFRVEGTLVRRGALSLSAYLAANAQGFKERAWRLGQVAAAAPLRLLLGQNDRSTANRAAYFALRGMSRDRVEMLCEEYLEDVLANKLLARGVELVQRARHEGYRIVLLAEAPDIVARGIAEKVGPVDHVVANRLEMRDGVATGALEGPVVGGFDARRLAEELAAQKGWSLGRSRAYAAFGPDLVLLGAVGDPCAVNPDYTLRRAAAEAAWPVMYYDA